MKTPLLITALAASLLFGCQDDETVQPKPSQCYECKLMEVVYLSADTSLVSVRQVGETWTNTCLTAPPSWYFPEWDTLNRWILSGDTLVNVYMQRKGI